MATILKFQSTRPRGARRRIFCIAAATASISIHAPTRGATTRYAPWLIRCKFQSTRPRGARPAVGCELQIFKEFQSTRPRGARQVLRFVMHSSHDFNPRAHAGRDQNSFNEVTAYLISIHAPTRGATDMVITSGHKRTISIHAPTRGATVIYTYEPKAGAFQSTRPRGARRAYRSATPLMSGFQSTRPRGARRAARFLIRVSIYISIHAPTRGATTRYCRTTPRSRISIHAPTRGATATSSPRIGCCVNFNPRAHAGRDCGFIQPAIVLSISIHAPTPKRSGAPVGISIHAPTRGATEWAKEQSQG